MGMLTLTSRKGESIVIEDQQSGEVLQIVVLERDHGHTKLGVEASRRFDVWREEIWLRRLRGRPPIAAAGGGS